MDAAISLPSFTAFLTYFGLGLTVLVATVAIVALVTPHREFALIRAGNAAAATGFAGLVIGLALPVQAAITHSVSIVDALVWGSVAAGVQVAAFLLGRLVVTSLSKQITDNVVSAGIFSAGISIAVGLINAAAMTP